MTLAADAQFDVAVIGGGIHGAGVAQAASAAGYKTLLVERHDWASATSRQSSKLVHGGLRYLESAQLSLVHHSLRERRLLLRNAPELVKAIPFFIPVYRETRRRPWQLRAGLGLYAVLSGLTRLSRFRVLPRRAWSKLNGLRHDSLEQVFSYWDAQTDDAALTRAVVASATALQAQCLERCELLRATPQPDGYQLTLRNIAESAHEDSIRQCRARYLVNAAGPWVNEVAQRCGAEPRAISWVKGSHIVLPAAPLPGVFYLEAPSDGRAVFVIPWRGKTLVGTTEIEVDNPDVTPSQQEIDYLLATVRHYFPDFPQQVQDAFAGVRVLPADNGRPFNRARESILVTSGKLLSIYGGKLTTYRHTAEQVIARLQQAGLERRTPLADTRTLHLSPG